GPDDMNEGVGMKVKRFHGATSREVLHAVREALGENAIILSNRNVASGVEVLAVAEDDMASIVGTPPAPAASTPTAEEIEVRSLLRGGERPFGKSHGERRVQHALPLRHVDAAGTPAAAEIISEEIKSMRGLIEKQLSSLAALPRTEAAPAA